MAQDQLLDHVKRLQAEGVPEADIRAFIDQFDGVAAPVSSHPPPDPEQERMQNSIFAKAMRSKGIEPTDAALSANQKMWDSGISGGIGGGPLKNVADTTAGVGRRLLGSLSRRMYGGLLKPSKAVRQEFGDVVPGLLEKRRLITAGGADAAETAVEQAANRADDMIANVPRPTQGVPANRVTSEFAPVLDAVKARVDAGVVPASELDKVVQRITRIRQTANASGGRIDPVRAQTLKRTSQEAAQGAYTQMQRGNSKMLGTDDLLDAATARGFKGGLEDIVPGIREANQTTQGLIGESRALTDAVGRTSNHLPFGSVSDLAALAVGHGNPVLGAVGKASTMALPGSAMAIGVNEASKAVDPAVLALMRLFAQRSNTQDEE